MVLATSRKWAVPATSFAAHCHQVDWQEKKSQKLYDIQHPAIRGLSEEDDSFFFKNHLTNGYRNLSSGITRIL